MKLPSLTRRTFLLSVCPSRNLRFHGRIVFCDFCCCPRYPRISGKCPRLLVFCNNYRGHIRTHHHDPAIFTVFGACDFAVVHESAIFSILQQSWTHQGRIRFAIIQFRNGNPESECVGVFTNALTRSVQLFSE